ncbi:MAG: hypothetical protein JXB07_14350 [Anaerolineae bacterium]|nr:hypothetical protein [Anaerolineae bacterium]
MENPVTKCPLALNRYEAIALVGALLAVIGCFLPWEYNIVGMFSPILSGIDIRFGSPRSVLGGSNSLPVILLAIVVTGLLLGTFYFVGRRKIGRYLAIASFVTVSLSAVTILFAEGGVKDNGGALIILFTTVTIWLLLRPPTIVPRLELVGLASGLVAVVLTAGHILSVSTGWAAALEWGLPATLVGTLLLLSGGVLDIYFAGHRAGISRRK